MKANGVKVLRVLTTGRSIILTIDAANVEMAQSILSSLNIMQQYGAVNPLRKPVANVLGINNAAEFNCLVQL